MFHARVTDCVSRAYKTHDLPVGPSAKFLVLFSGHSRSCWNMKAIDSRMSLRRERLVNIEFLNADLTLMFGTNLRSRLPDG